jgi:hypothetical protein
MIDISTIEYDVELVTENGTRYELNDALLSLEWEEQKSELAQRATLTVANFRIGNTYLMALAKLNCIIYIYARWSGLSRQLVFNGTIWDWQYMDATQKELTLTAYDPLIRLQQSQDFKYYSAGLTTQALIGDICNYWGVPLSYRWSRSLTHEKKVFNAEYISDMIIGLLEEVRQKSGEKYVAYFRDGQLQIVGYGTNSTVYKFDVNNTVSTSNKLSMSSLVTRVKIIGKQDDEERASIEAMVDGDMRYGALQAIMRRDGDKTLEAVMAEAGVLIEERGKPEETTRLNVPDVPFLRKGDKIEVEAGNLIGFFFVEGISHYATTRRMTLILSRPAPPPVRPAGGSPTGRGSAGRE